MKTKSKTKVKRLSPLERAMANHPKAKEIQRIQDKYVRVAKLGGSWNVYLQIDHQGFSVAEQTDKKRADWYGAMLGIALDRLVRNEMADWAERELEQLDKSAKSKTP